MHQAEVDCKEKRKDQMKKRRATRFSDHDAVTYKVPEAARVARVGEMAIRRGISEGRIPHIKFGRNILIPKSAFIRWLESCGAEK
jgi:excisionase family DNA binding protein